MKNKLLQSIGFKIIFSYVLLSLITLSFVISIIFENQTDLITKNTKLESEKQLSAIINSIKKFSSEMKKGSLFKTGGSKEALNQIKKILILHTKDYVIFTEKGEILYRSNKEMEIPENFTKDVMRSITAMTFSGKEYYLRIDEIKPVMYCYIPLSTFQLGNSVLLLKKDIGNLSESLINLYYQAVYVMIIVLIFHVIFALMLFRYIIRPVRLLTYGAKTLSEGKLYTRIPVMKRNDEFTELSSAFNRMAESMHKNIETLSVEKNSVSESAEKLEKMTTRDDLTGLYNRIYLLERVNEELNKTAEKQTGTGFLLIEVDNLSETKKIYGHQTCNIILTETAKAITRQCANTDIAARYEDVKFAVLSTISSLKNIQDLAEKIRQVIAENAVVTPDGDFIITVSIGIAYVDAANMDEVNGNSGFMALAEKALAEVKKKGKSRAEIIG